MILIFIGGLNFFLVEVLEGEGFVGLLGMLELVVEVGVFVLDVVVLEGVRGLVVVGGLVVLDNEVVFGDFEVLVVVWLFFCFCL